MADTQRMQNFRFWCQKVLPAVYDDSLSYYELLCKVVDYLNNVIDELNNHGDAISELQDSVTKLQQDFEKFKESGFDDYYARQIEAWVRANAERIIKEMMLLGVTFGLTSDGYFCAYIPQTWDDITFDTGAVYGSEQYGRLILKYQTSGQGVIDNTKYDVEMLDKAVRAAVDHYVQRDISAHLGNGLEVNPNTGMLEVPITGAMRYTADGLDVADADEVTRGSMKLTHDVSNDDSGEFAVTPDGVYAYAPSKAETVKQPDGCEFTDVADGVTISVLDYGRSGNTAYITLSLHTTAEIAEGEKIATPPAWVRGHAFAGSLELMQGALNAVMDIGANVGDSVTLMCKYGG